LRAVPGWAVTRTVTPTTAVPPVGSVPMWQVNSRGVVVVGGVARGARGVDEAG
jgi:hypothetical protein